MIDYERQDFTATSKIFDAVFDAVGKSSFGRCKPLLKKRGKFKSVIDKRYDFEKIPDAFRYVATGQKVGNVVTVY